MNPNENNINQKAGGIGGVIAVIIIVAVLAFGGYYFWSQVKEKTASNNANTVNPELQSTSTSAINTELEADLNTMQNDDLGQSDFVGIDNEFTQ
jgi:uncharacterized protein HemX